MPLRELERFSIMAKPDEIDMRAEFRVERRRELPPPPAADGSLVNSSCTRAPEAMPWRMAVDFRSVVGASPFTVMTRSPTWIRKGKR